MTLIRKISIVLAVMLLLGGLVGCGSDDDTKNNDNQQNNDECDDGDTRIVDCDGEEGEQPQICDDGSWVDDGECIVEPDELDPHCDIDDPEEATICVETATGEPGDVVAVEIHLLAPDHCTEVDQSFGNIKFDEQHFEFIEANNGDDCLMQDEREEPTHIYWHAFTAAAVGDVCPESLDLGAVDTLQFKISEDAKEDDYVLEMDTSTIMATQNEPDCDGDAGIDGVIRVLD